MNKLLSVSSISGGKTSSYMALHYPTNKYVFAVVKTLDSNAIPKDKGLLREVQLRIPDFVASRELDQTLKIVLDLEQEIGQKIDWVSSHLTYERQMLPNWQARLCTIELKLKPIFEYCYNLKSLGNMVLMNIGFRVDEAHRKAKMLADCKRAYQYKFPFLCDIKTRRQQWTTVEWRIPYFPLIEDNINHQQIIKFWNTKEWEFPSVSNCDYCFFHRYQEHQLQLSQYPERFQWWINQEKNIGQTFNKDHSYKEIQNPNISIQNTPLFVNCACTD